ncbi:hypothetical protein [Hymenobacter cellulosilyticus]|uniref:Uncharacterized protein n=1 Tax=Hymenobacter cellulosilyticus TaxID=2932248 RepID=A0A8T9Q219_9BACT|nr:hypothetical protein [Hymenobacter cellulosilyticus]UOQ70962.1 hypothetical protein MUN79_20125 [Hymenobacter cellulosilyticus]
MATTVRTTPIFFPITAQAPAQPWQQPAELLRQVLAQLDPKERRILDYISLPPEPPKPKAYPIGDCMKASRRISELLQVHPTWTQDKARRETARELGVSPVQLRRMLRHVEQ